MFTQINSVRFIACFDLRCLPTDQQCGLCKSTQPCLCSLLSCACILSAYTVHDALLDMTCNMFLQINSVDYVYQDGKAVKSIRLPGYAGASGLDADQQALREMKEEEEMNGTGQNDLEMV